jgi:hypothetical protein
MIQLVRWIRKKKKLFNCKLKFLRRSAGGSTHDLASQSIFAAFLERNKDGKICEFGAAPKQNSFVLDSKLVQPSTEMKTASGLCSASITLIASHLLSNCSTTTEVDESKDPAAESIFGAFLEKDKNGKICDFGPTTKSIFSTKSFFSKTPGELGSSFISVTEPVSIFAKASATTTTPFTNFALKDASKIFKESTDAEVKEPDSSILGNESISNGEDKESVVFSLRVKLYWRKTGAGADETKWAEAGKGPLRLLKSSSNEKEVVSTRLVMRRELSENGAGPYQ